VDLDALARRAEDPAVHESLELIGDRGGFTTSRAGGAVLWVPTQAMWQDARRGENLPMESGAVPGVHSQARRPARAGRRIRTLLAGKKGAKTRDIPLPAAVTNSQPYVRNQAALALRRTDGYDASRREGKSPAARGHGRRVAQTPTCAG